MAGGKRPLSVKAKASIESAIEDKETPFDNIEEMDQHSDDDDSSDSSVYSELDGESHVHYSVKSLVLQLQRHPLKIIFETVLRH